jgi:hypothetical protein
MKINALLLKNWCNQHITPLAWQRIIMRVLPSLREAGLDLSDLQEPAENLFFEEEILAAFEVAMYELYEQKIPMNMIEA